jgi:hypothetical protein
MMPADEYERMYREQGRAAADAEFDRQMRGEYLKIAIFGVGLAICILLVVVIA